VTGLSLGYLSDDDSSVDSEELDDLYLATPPGARLGEKDVLNPARPFTQIPTPRRSAAFASRSARSRARSRLSPGL
jgi:hypothetical protein